MPRKTPGSSVKDPEMYEALRDDGASKEKAARISNAASNTSRSMVDHKGSSAGSYDNMTKQELLGRAREIGIRGRSTMNKEQLIEALRDR
ncbi:MAG: Rho termination factor N-terminal domain-containing protein [Humibacillus sp.]|nr:Rho termination factor N-terminal domain-containing protein [Humibacillus sp.]MDN5777197.1 Rho termination factor N-terminal domain-containing protein [Humibacillus sp.]